jgi:hypothetical protein
MHRFKVEVITAVAAWVITSACQNVPVARNWLRGVSPRGVDVNALAQKLSSTAKIYHPGSVEFEEASARWSVLDAPQVNVVVVPGTENDVAETVNFLTPPLSPHFLYGSCAKPHRFQ